MPVSAAVRAAILCLLACLCATCSQAPQDAAPQVAVTRAALLDDGLVAYWAFDNAGADESGNGNDLDQTSGAGVTYAATRS
jgi:hypothetical protein